jgi:L-lactate dehydrogenase
MKPFKSSTILLLVANPVDVLTFFAQKFSDLPKNQVIGSGTFLDSARLRGILAQKLHVAASSIDAHVLGEHGESQFVAWSLVNVGGLPLDHVSDQSLDKGKIAEDTKDKATEIINNKGVTNYGIGAVVASLCKSVLFDQRDVVPVSHWQEGLGVCLSVPVVLGREGVGKALGVRLNEKEEEQLKESAGVLKEMVEG